MTAAIRARKLARVAKRKARRPLAALKKFRPVLYLKNRKFPLWNFQPKVLVQQASENFILKTAETPQELKEALQLRHEIFYRELQGKETKSKLDLDELDELCDHLIIVDKKSSRIVGTYRMISSTFSSRFYSEGEFNISGILKLPGNKLELGRACIHPDFRTGAIINLLWKGIAEYIKKTDTKYLFGCASVQTVDPREASRLLTHLRSQGLSLEEYGVRPTEKYESELIDLPASPEEKIEIPALIQSYILAGTKFYGKPALDRDFECYDFFMMLKVGEMSRLFKRRYRLDD